MGALPGSFADLDRWSHWCLPDELGRSRKRAAISAGVLRAFYDALAPRIAAIL